MDVDEADLIWNRAAALGNGGGSPRAGDTALATALAFHGLAMSGGVLDAVERTSAAINQAEAAFRWLGLEFIAALLASIQQDVTAGTLEDDDQAEALEREADERYNAILPSDAILEAAFRARLQEDRTAFAVLQNETP
jgi:hypothetical protein